MSIVINLLAFCLGIITYTLSKKIAYLISERKRRARQEKQIAESITWEVL